MSNSQTVTSDQSKLNNCKNSSLSDAEQQRIKLKEQLAKKMKSFRQQRSGQRASSDSTTASVLSSLQSGVATVSSRKQQKELRQAQARARAGLEAAGINMAQAQEMLSKLSTTDRERWMSQFTKSGQSLDAALDQLSSVTGSKDTSSTDSKTRLESALFAPQQPDADQTVQNPTTKELDEATKKGLPIMDRAEFFL